MSACVQLKDQIHNDEIVATVLQPHFDAVRDVYAAFRPAPGAPKLEKLRGVRFVIDAQMHNSPRHFAAVEHSGLPAATRDDGLLMIFAPQIVQLPVETVVAILAHEFGHAADYAYPAQWLTRGIADDTAQWIGDQLDTKHGRKWRRLWYDQQRDSEAGRDRIEWRADAIAAAVTGKRLGYAGPCMLQTFGHGGHRPPGLR